MTLLTALLTGLLFGLGLILAGMTDPAKVQGFLDLAGAWNPSLALVMVGAIAVGLLGFAHAKQRGASWLGLRIQLPQSKVIDRRLLWGSAAFGVGWGLAGYCPGPAIVALAEGRADAAWMVAGMVMGMALYEWLQQRGKPRA